MFGNYDEYDNYDRCYECRGYGNDYILNEDGEFESNCTTCLNNPINHDGDWDLDDYEDFI